MEKEYLISVIIPVYNKEPYLRECLDSVLNQSYKNLEVICIDDGSTDNSISILEEYVNRDKRVSLFKSEHKGPSATRNIGIKQCHGDYIHFMDADDYLKQGCYSKIINILKIENKQYDLFKFYIDWSNQTMKQLNKDYRFVNKFGDKDYQIVNLDNDSDFVIYESHNLADKLIKRDLIINNKLIFNENTKYFEDGEMFYNCISLSNEICCLPYDYYFYRQNIDNQQSKKILDKNIFLDDFTVFENCYKKFEFRNDFIKLSFIKDFLKSVMDDLDRVDINFKFFVYENFINFLNKYNDDLYFQKTMKFFPKEISKIYNFYFLNKTNNKYNPLISVVIPIYNKKNYIDECLKSIANQTYKNLQIICVDDNSTDGSFEYIKEKFKDDQRFMFIKNENNMGLCKSRNVGIEFVKGDFIHFVDADDVVKQDSYLMIVNILNYISKNIDLVSFYNEPFDDQLYAFGKININEVFVNRFNNVFSLINLYDNPDFYIYGKGGGPSVWMKLFKTKIIRENKIFFDPVVSFNEDLDYCFRYYQYVTTSLSLAYDYYNYRINVPGQMMNKVLNTPGKFSLVFTCFNKSKDFYYSTNDNLKYYFIKTILDTAFVNYSKINNFDARYKALIDLENFIENNKKDNLFSTTINEYIDFMNILIFNKEALKSNIDYINLHKGVVQELTNRNKEIENKNKELEEKNKEIENKNKELEEKNKEIERKINEITKKNIDFQDIHNKYMMIINSNSYKIGRKMTYPIRLIKRIIKKQ